MAKLWPLLTVIVCVPSIANAATMVVLHYRTPAHARCPSQSELEGAVSARLGYVPFAVAAERTVNATIVASGKSLIGQIELLDGDGAVRGSRSLSGAGNDCEELAASLELAITLAIDPLVMQRPAAPASAPAVVAAPLKPPSEPAPLPPPGPSPRPAVRLGAAVLGALGAAPNVVPGFEIEAGLAWTHFSLALAGHVDAAATTPLIQTQLLYGTLSPCFHYSVAMVCGRVLAGALRGAGAQIANPRQDTTFYAAAGLRAGVEVCIYRQLFFAAFIDLNAVLTRTTISVNSAPVWITPPFNGDLGVQLLVLL